MGKWGFIKLPFMIGSEYSNNGYLHAGEVENFAAVMSRELDASASDVSIGWSNNNSVDSLTNSK